MSVVVKNDNPQLENIRKMMALRHGILLTSDLAEFNIPRTYLSILEKRGEIERISRGVYRLINSIEDGLFSVQARYKNSIYSHETALFIHDLTDRAPLLYSISVPIGYHTTSLNKSGHKIYYVNPKLFNLGVVIQKSPHENEIKITGLERTVVDILRNRNRIDDQIINEALKRYVKRDEKNIDLLNNYAKQFRIQKVMRGYIEVLL
jgi:predicted transcriptional regulator of viral defense system